MGTTAATPCFQTLEKKVFTAARATARVTFVAGMRQAHCALAAAEQELAEARRLRAVERALADSPKLRVAATAEGAPDEEDATAERDEMRR
jgi:hypothetical protein